MKRKGSSAVSIESKGNRLQQRTDSSQTLSSLGEISENSAVRRPLGGDAQHYGALKHLAANVGTNTNKKNLLFTRNTQLNSKKMTSFDENVRVN